MVKKIEKPATVDTIIYKVNEIIDYINILIDIVNVHEREGDKVQTEVEKLREMLKDPRYWRDHDNDIVQKVEDGFKKLYGDKK